MRRSRFKPGLPLFLASLVLAGIANAQANPFADFDSTFPSGGIDAADSATPSGNASARADLDLDNFTQQLRRMAGGRPSQVAAAIREACRLKLWNEVSLYVTTDHYNTFDVAQLGLIARTVGGLQISRAIAADSLSDEAKPQFDKLHQILSEDASDAAAIADAIQGLASPDPDIKLGAARRILRGGEVALHQLIDAAVVQDPAAPRKDLIQLLRAFRPQSTEAAAQLAMFGTDEIRGNAMVVLFGLSPEDALAPLLSAQYSLTATSLERDVAESGLIRLIGAVPNDQAAAERLTRRLDQQLQAYHLADSLALPRRTVRISDDRKTIQFQDTTLADLNAVRAADTAELLRRMGTLPPQSLVRALAATLQHNYLSSPEFGSREDLDSLSSQWGDAVRNVAVLNQILQQALGSVLASNDQPVQVAAAIGAIRVLGALQSPAAITSVEGQPSPLVQATAFSDPRVRYEAAIAIGQISPEQPFAGSGRVLEQWLEMASLEAEPTAIVILPQPELRQQMVAFLSQSGFQVITIGSQKEMLQQVELSGDVSLIVATSEPADTTAVCLLDTLRRHRYTANTPMVFVGAEREGLRQAFTRWTAAAELIAMPKDQQTLGDAGPPALLARQAVSKLAIRLPGLLSAGPMPPISQADRQLYAFDGRRQLARLAENKIWESVFDWRDRESDILASIGGEGYGPGEIDVLSALGSATSQELLVDLVANPSVPDSIREEAATGFEKSISRFGTRFPRDRVQQQYDRYNQTNNETTRELLGRILDAMETRVGVSSKPPSQ